MVISSLQCKTCLNSAPISEAATLFYRRNNGKPMDCKSGWNTVCKECYVQKNLVLRTKQAEKISVNKKIYYEANKEKIKAYKKVHYFEHREHYSEKNKSRYYSTRSSYLDKKRSERLERLTSEDRIELQRKRWVRNLPPEERFFYDKFKEWETSARGRNIAFSITLDIIKHLWHSQQGKCFYTGLPLELKSNVSMCISLDRSDSNIGYFESNVVLCGKQINLMKHILDSTDFISTCKLIARRF